MLAALLSPLPVIASYITVSRKQCKQPTGAPHGRFSSIVTHVFHLPIQLLFSKHSVHLLYFRLRTSAVAPVPRPRPAHEAPSPLLSTVMRMSPGHVIRQPRGQRTHSPRPRPRHRRTARRVFEGITPLKTAPVVAAGSIFQLSTPARTSVAWVARQPPAACYHCQSGNL